MCGKLADMLNSLTYPITDTCLPNGLRVVVQTDQMSPCFAINLAFKVGSADENPGMTGFAHLFEHLMFQGSANVAPGEHFALLEAAGGRTNATTHFDQTNYFETVPRGALELALWLEADRMASLSVTQANFDAQREVVKEEKRQSYDNQPYGDLLDLLLGQHFSKDHPYGHLVIGSMTDLDAAELSDVKQFFDTWYSPANATLTLVGPIEANEGFALAQKYFCELSSNTRPPTRRPCPDRLSPSRKDHSAQVPQDLLYLSWQGPRADDPMIEPIDLLIAILGDGLSSRLHRSLIKDNQLADSVGVSSLELSRTGSISTISVRLDEHNSTELAEEAVLEVLDSIQTAPPGPAEMDRALAQIERSYLSALASVEHRADLISGATLWLDDPDRVNSFLSRMAGVTPSQVQEAAEKYFGTDNCFVLNYRKEN